MTRDANPAMQMPGADTGFCVRGGAYRDGNGACSSKLARVSGKAQ